MFPCLIFYLFCILISYFHSFLLYFPHFSFTKFLIYLFILLFSSPLNFSYTCFHNVLYCVFSIISFISSFSIYQSILLINLVSYLVMTISQGAVIKQQKGEAIEEMGTFLKATFRTKNSYIYIFFFVSLRVTF